MQKIGVVMQTTFLKSPYKLLEDGNFVFEGLIVLNSAFLHCFHSHLDTY